MEVEQRFPRMQLVRKAAEQYQRLILERTRPSLVVHQQTNRDAHGSVPGVQQHPSGQNKRAIVVGGGGGGGGGSATSVSSSTTSAKQHGLSTLRKWTARPTRNGFSKGPANCEDSHRESHSGDTGQQQQQQGRSSRTNSINGSDMSMLQLLAFNALDLTAPASDVLLKNRRSSWVQLSGHPGCFAPAGLGTLWKKQGTDYNEQLVYEALMKDSACDIVPKFYRNVVHQGESFIEMEDLLHGFTDPNVMDIKMGTRTFLESEVTNTTARSDLYQKMMKVEPSAATQEEHELQAVTKLRYMMFREQQSSSCNLGFRIEAIKFQGKPPVNDLKTVSTPEAVQSTLEVFLNRCPNVKKELLTRLQHIRHQFQHSPYFATHEVVGSSILIIYDRNHVGAWMIDFAKTLPLPDSVTVTHRKPWQQGNHEEGWLTGMDNLIKAIEAIDCIASANIAKGTKIATNHSL